MKTIEKIADNYASGVKSAMEADGVDMTGRVAELCLRMVRESFIHGAEQMHEELTRWHDPQEVLPENNVCVLLKVVDQLYNEAIYLGSREGGRIYDRWRACARNRFR